MKLILSHPTANANVRSAANGLREAELLYRFHTSLASFPGSLLDRLTVFPPLKEIKRRQFNVELKSVTKQSPWRELGRHLAPRLGLSQLTDHESGIFSVDAMYRYIDTIVAAGLNTESHKGVTGVYSYEDGSYNSFSKAREIGLKCFYDLPIGYWRSAIKILEKEKEQWPEWESTLKNFEDSSQKLHRKDEEIRLADVIFVASSFTAQSLKEYPGKLPPVEIIPYGYPKVETLREYTTTGNRPLKLLFVGGLSQRKGIANMFEAVKRFHSDVSLTVVGQKTSNNCPVLDQALLRHRWIPGLSHKEILELMKAHDVLMFPSLFEGFGLVITEAMSQGTPVITTNRTAGPDLIAHGENGWLVEPGSTVAIEECLEHLLQHPEEVVSAGKAAQQSARLRTWEVYGRELAETLMHYSS